MMMAYIHESAEIIVRIFIQHSISATFFIMTTDEAFSHQVKKYILFLINDKFTKIFNEENDDDVNETPYVQFKVLIKQ